MFEHTKHHDLQEPFVEVSRCDGEHVDGVVLLLCLAAAGWRCFARTPETAVFFVIGRVSEPLNIWICIAEY